MSDRSKPIPITIDKRTLDASVDAAAKLIDQVFDLQDRLRVAERQRDNYAAQLVLLQMDRDEWQARATSPGHNPGHNSPGPAASDPADANSSSCAGGDSNSDGLPH
jgi:hypothetical protein